MSRVRGSDDEWRMERMSGGVDYFSNLSLRHLDSNHFSR